MDLDYSTFSIRHALGSQAGFTQCSSMTTRVVPQGCTFAEPEAFLSRNQEDATQNLDDVDAMSYSMHHSFNTNPQHAHSIYPPLSFPNTFEDCVPSHPGFAVQNTSSAHVYQEHNLQDPLIAWATSHQPLLPDLANPSSEIALAPGAQWSGVQPIEAAKFSRTAGQGHQCDALSLDITIPHFYSNPDDKNELTHPTSPPFSLDSIDSTRPPWFYQHPELRYPHVPAVFFPVADYCSSPGSYVLPAQEDTVGVSSQLNAHEGQQLGVSRGTAGLPRPSYYIRSSTQPPPHSYSADPPRSGGTGKRLRRTSSDSNLADRDTTIAAPPQARNSRSESGIKRAVTVPHGAQPPVHLRVQHVNVAPLVEISRLQSSVPQKVDCDGRLVDESAVRNHGRPLLHVYKCQWDTNHSPCGMHIEGDQPSVTDHLVRFHGFTGGEGDTACLWGGCVSKKRAAMKGTSIARHLVTHIGYKIKCTACNVDYAREDACRRSHANARSECQTMQIAPVHGPGVIALKVRNCEPATKKRRVADA